MGKIKVFEAFAGIGTQHMALKRSGIPFEIVGISEIKDPAIKSYTAIHDEVKNFGDISKVNANSIPDFDLLTYSFPCQDISREGKGAGLSEGIGTRSSLLWECKRLILEKRPKYLLLENVKDLVNKKHKQDFEKWNAFLNSIGYKTFWNVLNANDYGIPQKRERVFSVSILGDVDFTFPEYTGESVTLQSLLEPNPGEEYYLPDEVLESFLIDKQGDTLLVRANTKKGYEELNVGDAYNYSHPNSKTRRGRVGRGVVPTLLTSVSIAVLTEDHRLRKLTPLEYWRLTGISDEDYYKAVGTGISPNQLYAQAGNAIVVNVMEAIFKELLSE